MEYKRSYAGLIIWLILFVAATLGACFLPIEDTKLIITVVDNIMTVSIFILSLIIYLKDKAYWYTEVSFKDAEAAGFERRRRYAFRHMKRFGIGTVAFAVYSVISLLVGIPYGVDIAMAMVAVIIPAISTCWVKL